MGGRGSAALVGLTRAVLAVLAVSAFLGLCLVLFGESPRPRAVEPAARASLPTRPAVLPVVTPSPTVTVTPTATPAASTASPTTTRTHGATPSVTPSGRAVTARPRVPAIEVVVLNNSRTAGLAGRTSERLEADGWQVPVVGNFFGSIPESTVYYPPGRALAARRLADALGLARVRPAFDGVSSSRLTVVLTDGFALAE